MTLSLLCDILGGALALATLPGTLELIALTSASLFWKPAPPSDTPIPLNLAVVIPAHNEEATIPSCLESLMACDPGGHRFQPVVVADNCSDRTGLVASRMGARVLTRTDPERRGKGAALSHAFRLLLQEPFDAFIVVDADSRVDNNFISCLAGLFARGAMAVQCRYLPDATGRSLRSRLMNLALISFHVVRPRGRSMLGFSAGLFGNGFGLARGALLKVPYQAGSIAEDLEYHVSLVRHGIRVVFADATTAWSAFPQDENTATVQRSRWEGGRFRIMINSIPGLLRDCLRKKRAGTEALFDLLTLPLAFHVTLILLSAMAPPAPARGYAFVALGVVAFHVVSAIAIAGTRRDVMALLAAPPYIVWKLIKLPFILKTARKDARWVRTPRQNPREGKLL
jgi:cellulose synthase/poly-beta-1,6-N-acetylglucosamine synthase-like glycosyltransferase